MRKVNRLPKPKSLRDNARRWTQELLSEILRKRSFSRVSNKFLERYKKKDIRRALEKMYSGLCCYCEENTGVVEFGHIEHRMPKSLFPQKTYDWDNLHLSCTYCNTRKGEQYNKKYPILDATKDCITDYLTYRAGEAGIWRFPLKERGLTTINHADLNREKLSHNRFQISRGVIRVIKKINSSTPTMDSNIQDFCKIQL